MHPVLFQTKRLHLCQLRRARQILGCYMDPSDPDFDGVEDMTPARFDILFLLHSKWSWRERTFSLRQKELRERLGLAGATISKAVKRLVELGLVTRAPATTGDKRCKIVKLTEEGIARIRRALHLVFTKRSLAGDYRYFYMFRDLLAGIRPVRQYPLRVAATITELARSLRALSFHFGDDASVVYPLDVRPRPSKPQRRWLKSEPNTKEAERQKMLADGEALLRQYGL